MQSKLASSYFSFTIYLSAVISTGKPIPSGISKSLLVASPGYPVAFSSEVEMTGYKKLLS